MDAGMRNTTLSLYIYHAQTCADPLPEGAKFARVFHPAVNFCLDARHLLMVDLQNHGTSDEQWTKLARRHDEPLAASH
jgi:hypothetical protein